MAGSISVTAGANKLTLNLQKTKAMCFGTKHTLNQIRDLEVNYGSTSIETVNKIKYLGIILDSKLSFTEHVDYLKGKAILRLKMLGKTRGLVSVDTSLQLYKTIITLLFDYAAPAYDYLSQQDSYKLQKNIELCPKNHIARKSMESYKRHASRGKTQLSSRQATHVDVESGIQVPERSCPAKYLKSN